MHNRGPPVDRPCNTKYLKSRRLRGGLPTDRRSNSRAAGSSQLRNRELGTNTRQGKGKVAEHRFLLMGAFELFKFNLGMMRFGVSPVRIGESPMECRSTFKMASGH
ncbi:hypothetical protein HAX54_031224 [Datura stramonium]|uniref:Uncharacterized protein n=1 Tax=Datura stramonium TaxID=4076 RepID=A0ABS8SBS9_DATST|nr:hypothetical protein [Datura stramonium]